MVKFRKGQRVKLLDSNMEGTIVGKDENGNVVIETPDGMRIPVSPRQIIVSSEAYSDAISRTKATKKSANVISRGNSSNSDAGKSSIAVKHRKSSVDVIDLHIESIIKNHQSIQPEEYLDRQITFFRREAARLIKNGRRELFVIHGEGKGVLREAIIKVVSETWPESDIMDAPYYKFRFGATRIIIKSR